MSAQFSRTPHPSPVPAARRAEIVAEPGFGRHFTDHMVTIAWTEGQGWHDAAVVPYGPISLDPASAVLHYGQEIFEGLKAYQQPDGSVASFRPGENAARFRSSAVRLGMPQLPDELFLGSLSELLAVDRGWMPPAGGEESMYLRPFLIATEVGLGVKPSSEYLFLLIASPAGAYFPGGVKPVSVWWSTEYVRAAPGGTGAAKFGGNYAASLAAQAQAAETAVVAPGRAGKPAHLCELHRQAAFEGRLHQTPVCEIADPPSGEKNGVCSVPKFVCGSGVASASSSRCVYSLSRPSWLPRPVNTRREPSGESTAVTRGARIASGPRSTENRVSPLSTGRAACHHPYAVAAAISSSTATVAGHRKLNLAAAALGIAPASSGSSSKRASLIAARRWRGSFCRHARSRRRAGAGINDQSASLLRTAPRIWTGLAPSNGGRPTSSS
jgi:hypothetical protein